METAEIVICGAGIAGASAAYHLAALYVDQGANLDAALNLAASAKQLLPTAVLYAIFLLLCLRGYQRWRMTLVQAQETA